MSGKPPLTPYTIEIGDGVTFGVGSDRYAGTVTDVSASKKTIKFQQDKAKMKSGCSIYEHQDYDYTRDENGTVRSARWSGARNAYVVVGQGRILTPGRNQYYDPSF